MASHPVNDHHDAASTASTLSSSLSSWTSSQYPQPYSNLRLHSGDGVKLLLRIPSHSVDAVLVTFPDPFFDDYCENEQDRRDPQDHHYTECRLLQLNVLAQMWRVLVASSSSSLSTPSTSGRLYLATDHSGYHAWSHQQVERFNRQKLQKQQLLHGSQSRGRSTTGSNNDHISNTKTTGVAHFALIDPTPDRRQWLPVISKYEQKGWNEGRSTHLSCWEATTTLECEH